MKHFVSRGRGKRPTALRAKNERGTAILIAVMVLALLGVFVASTLTRVTGEAATMANDAAATIAYHAAQSSLERMTRDFDKLFDTSPSPSASFIAAVEADVPTIPGFDIEQHISDLSTVSEQVNVADGPFVGLVSLRDRWRLDTIARSTSGRPVTVRLTRTLNNYLIPIFQFGIFYDDDMEFHPGPVFRFGGRVHSNRHIYMMAGSGCYFRDRVTAHGEVVTDVAHNGSPASNWGNNIYVYNGSSYQKVSTGSVTGGPDISGTDDLQPDGSSNASGWATFSTRFNGRLVAGAPSLRLPLQIGTNLSPLEIIRRGIASDTSDETLAKSRYYNKPGIRITLSDSQAKLPGGTGGRRLDGNADGLGGQTTGDRGYWPRQRLGSPAPARATRINGNRLYAGGGRQHWIKVEMVTLTTATFPSDIVTTDITEDFLSLGMTERDAQLGVGDPDAIVKIQRFSILGPPIKVTQGTVQSTSTTTAAYSQHRDGRSGSILRDVYTRVIPAGSTGRSVVRPRTRDTSSGIFSDDDAYVQPWWVSPATFSSTDEQAHEVVGTVTGTTEPRYVPFPILMFDTREGLYNDNSSTPWDTLYNTSGNPSQVPVNGVMGCVDFDVANFRRFITGAFTGQFPNGLDPANIPDNDDHGWIVYVSDRRGDADNDGYWDMENVVVTNATDTTANSTDQPYLDANHDGTIQADYTDEGATYAVALPSDLAATHDTKYFRRCTRLVNGTNLPGGFNAGTGIYSGFSFASENGCYIIGNYNADPALMPGGVLPSGTPTAFDQYPTNNVPASVVADAVTILSVHWNDGKSFRYPFGFGSTTAGDNFGRRVPSGGTNETTVRAALLMGDTQSWAVNEASDSATQGGGDGGLAGGVHNFKRFREDWNSYRFNYCGSLINLYHSVQNTGPFKCCVHVYSPPTRNWVFDSTFLDPNRLPPGTPFFQYLNITGFRQVFS